MNETLLTARDAGALLRVGPVRTWQLAKSGALPAVRDSTGRYLFRRRDVEKLVVQRERERQACRP